MGFQPDYQLNIISDEGFAAGMDKICRELDTCRISGYFSGVSNIRLFYEYFPAENCRGSVVMLHGMSEFTRKHYELAYYLLHQGYSVFMYDQRGHGMSQRLTDQLDLIHVERFSDFVEDLDLFVRNIVLPAATKPLYLYGHSMGGAVSLFYMAAHPEVFRKVILSSPLFEPHVGVPAALAAVSALTDQLLRGDKSKMSHSREFVAKMPEQWESDPACSRNKYMMQLRIDNPNYQTTPMTAGFALRALHLTPQLLRLAKKIRTPHLLISGDRDAVVKTQPHQRFAALSPLCKLVRIPDGQHAMMCDDAKSAAGYTRLVLDFLEDAV